MFRLPVEPKTIKRRWSLLLYASFLLTLGQYQANCLETVPLLSAPGSFSAQSACRSSRSDRIRAWVCAACSRPPAQGLPLQTFAEGCAMG